jgi:HPt (histidine-containing phosphotransfer) domain-containing protein
MIDIDKLNDLMELMGDDFPILIQSYINDNSSLLQELKQAVNNYAETDIRKAHSIKSTSLNIGAVTVAETARAIEEQLKAAQPLDESQWLNLSQIFQQTVAKLQEMIS